MQKPTPVYLYLDVHFVSSDSPDAEHVKPHSNLLTLLNSEKALIELLILCGINIHILWNVSAAI